MESVPTLRVDSQEKIEKICSRNSNRALDPNWIGSGKSESWRGKSFPSMVEMNYNIGQTASVRDLYQCLQKMNDDQNTQIKIRTDYLQQLTREINGLRDRNRKFQEENKQLVDELKKGARN